MELRRVIESLRHWAIASKESSVHDTKTLRHNDATTLGLNDPKTPWVILLVASGFGAGYCPIAPGTMGTVLAIPIALFFSSLGFPFYELTIVAFFFVSVWICGRAREHWGGRDDARIVLDEIIGFLVTTLWIEKTPLFLVLGFLFFRFLDIVKPPPIRHLEKLPGGMGVVMDDVLAGGCACVILHVIGWIGR